MFTSTNAVWAREPSCMKPAEDSATMTKWVAIAVATLCLGCSPGSEGQTSSTPEPKALHTNQAASTSTTAGFCEFSLGQPVPSAQQSIATRTIPTEGDERVFFDYRACQGRVPVTIELQGQAVWSISIKGVGNCLANSVCVGDSYRQSSDRFPEAKQLLSRVEGKNFSLLVRDGLTLIFPIGALADECFVHPESCDEQIQQSRVEAIFLYDR